MQQYQQSTSHITISIFNQYYYPYRLRSQTRLRSLILLLHIHNSRAEHAEVVNAFKGLNHTIKNRYGSENFIKKSYHLYRYRKTTLCHKHMPQSILAAYYTTVSIYQYISGLILTYLSRIKDFQNFLYYGRLLGFIHLLTTATHHMKQ